MDQTNPNIYVSNGTCYYGPNLEADPAMIPCGNDYFGHVACCQANDTCLETSACWHAEYAVTYVAGCTDPSYDAIICPDKFEDEEAPWLGMSYCNGTSNDWVLCDQPDHPGTLESPAECYCPTPTSERTMTMFQYSTIPATAYLPSTVGLEIAYVPGYYPSYPASTVSPTATISNSISGAIATLTGTVTVAIPSSTNLPTQSTPQGLSTSATVGTAIGAAIAGILLLGAAGFLLFRRRRRLLHRKKGLQVDNCSNENSYNDSENNKPPSDSGIDPATTGIAYGGGGGGRGNEAASQISSPQPSTVSELENKPARPWSMGSELEDNGTSRPMSMASPTRMEAIMEHGYGHADHGYGNGQTGPSELAACPLVELEG